MIHIEVKRTIGKDEVSLGTEVENNESVKEKMEELQDVFNSIQQDLKKGKGNPKKLETNTFSCGASGLRI